MNKSTTIPAALLAAWAGPALAHAGTGLAGGFGAGFAHPFGGMDHLLAMVSVGLWGAFLGEPLVYRLPVVFPGLMVLGAVLGMAGVALPPVECGIALSVLLLGVCIAAAWRPPAWVAIGIVAAFGLFHGYAHGRELPSAAAPLGYAAGFVLATGSLHVSGIGLGAFSRWRRGAQAIRFAGAAVAACGVWFLVQALSASGHAVRASLVPLVVLGLAVAITRAGIARRAATRPHGKAIAWQVLLSWLIAVAVLTATLAFLPVTPGYAPDHLE